jgi:hypothetical protein
MTYCNHDYPEAFYRLRSRKGRSLATTKLNAKKNINTNKIIQQQPKSDENVDNISFNESNTKTMEESIKLLQKSIPPNLCQTINYLKKEMDKVINRLNALEGGHSSSNKLTSLNLNTERANGYPAQAYKQDNIFKLENEVYSYIKQTTKDMIKKHEDNFIEFIEFQMESIDHSRAILKESASKVASKLSVLVESLCSICHHKSFSIKQCLSCKKDCCMSCRCKCGVCNHVFCKQCFYMCGHCNKKLCIRCSESCVICNKIKCQACGCREYCQSKLESTLGAKNNGNLLHLMLSLPQFRSFSLQNYNMESLASHNFFGQEYCKLVCHSLQRINFPIINVNDLVSDLTEISIKDNLLKLFSKFSETIAFEILMKTEYIRREDASEIKMEFEDKLLQNNSTLSRLMGCLAEYIMKCPFCGQQYVKYQFGPSIDSTPEGNNFPKDVLVNIDYSRVRDSTTCVICKRIIASSLIQRNIITYPSLLVIEIITKEGKNECNVCLNDTAISLAKGVDYSACAAISNDGIAIRVGTGWKYVNVDGELRAFDMNINACLLIFRKIDSSNIPGDLIKGFVGI